MPERCDAVVVGGGVVGVAVAWHLARFGARKVRLIERGTLGGGTTAQSSCILRTHYSVRENAALARAALEVFADLPGYLEDPEADCGFTRCGYLIVAPDGAPRGGGARVAGDGTRTRHRRPARSAPTTRDGCCRCCTSTTSPASAGSRTPATPTPI